MWAARRSLCLTGQTRIPPGGKGTAASATRTLRTSTWAKGSALSSPIRRTACPLTGVPMRVLRKRRPWTRLRRISGNKSGKGIPLVGSSLAKRKSRSPAGMSLWREQSGPSPLRSQPYRRRSPRKAPQKRRTPGPPPPVPPERGRCPEAPWPAMKNRVSARKKALRRSFAARRRRKKIQSVFAGDMRTGKNTSQF